MIVITGAGGQSGSWVADALKNRTNGYRITPGSRVIEKMAGHERQDCKTMRIDFDAPGTHDSVFARADTMPGMFAANAAGGS